jgi:hypothetical protein
MGLATRYGRPPPPALGASEGGGAHGRVVAREPALEALELWPQRPPVGGRSDRGAQEARRRSPFASPFAVRLRILGSCW